MEEVKDRIRQEEEKRLNKAWRVPSGWRYWSEVNNSEVGMWYTVTSLAFFFFAGVLALLIRVQLAVPDNNFLTAEQYNQIFTMHGTVMMFLFAIPIFEAISILLLPQMLGARDLPFPRLSAYGYWCFLLGGIFVCGSLFFGAAPKGGWFMYPPLTTSYQPGVGADIWLLGLTFIEIASIAASVELIVGILKCRPPGMRINLIPIYAWYILVVAIMILFAFPPLIAGDILLEMERAFNWPFFDASRGGDPLLWQHLFWIFGHPEVYIIFLPSIALLATIIPTFARVPLIGYSWVVLSAVGTGFLSFGLWVHHMFTTGLPGISLGIFSAASQAVAIPTGVQLFCFLATLLIGRSVKAVPMLFAIGGLATFVIGGLTGVMLAIAPFNFQAHDSFFIVGHLHYVLIGGSVFPILAGIYYYAPIIIGKKLSDKLGKICFWLVLIGFNVTFFPMHASGLLGMPRRIYTYSDDMGVSTLNLISSIGAFILGTGFLVLLWDLLRPKGKLSYSERNPWKAGTLEWSMKIPDRMWGIRSIPMIKSRYPLWEQPNFIHDVDNGHFYLPDAAEVMRETLVTSTLDAKPVQCLRVPGPTFITHLAALFSGGFFIFATYHWWVATTISGILAMATIIYWLWTGSAWIPEKEEKDVGLGVTLPIYQSGPHAVGWWAMFITMLADLTAFISLIFGYFFYWTIQQNFPPEDSVGPGIFWPVTGALLISLSWLLTKLAKKLNNQDKAILFYGILLLAVFCSLAGALAFLAGPLKYQMDPTHHVYEATVWILVIWTALHAALGALMQLYCMARRLGKKMTAKYDADITNVSLYESFIAITGLITAMVIAGFPAAS
ncbi:MAG: cytochrome c oxidase subunit I [Bacteriovoracaceae bacterium]|nr:cytochrome c oxidase subunit I [Bacteriovoracaceae bacterium]